MPFFRDEIDKELDEDFLPFETGQTDEERMNNARWLYQCGWWVDAFHIIHSIAKRISDEEPRQPQEAPNYEETRFGYDKDTEGEKGVRS